MPTGRVIRMENVRIITTVMACNYNGLGLIFFSKPFLLRVGKIFLFDRRKKYIYKRSGREGDPSSQPFGLHTDSGKFEILRSACTEFRKERQLLI